MRYKCQHLRMSARNVKCCIRDLLNLDFHIKQAGVKAAETGGLINAFR